MSERKSTLCWRCDNNAGLCEWSQSFKPVPGWDAERKDILSSSGATESYIVYRCPKFKWMKGLMK